MQSITLSSFFSDEITCCIARISFESIIGETLPPPARKAQASANSDTLKFSDLTLHCDTLTAVIGAEEVRLTRTECAILKLLMQNPNSPVGRTTILDKISLDTPDCTERSLKQHISNMRKKLELVSGKDYIEAVYGIGFKMRG